MVDRLYFFAQPCIIVAVHSCISEMHSMYFNSLLIVSA
jgi:hypothetical protein